MNISLKGEFGTVVLVSELYLVVLWNSHALSSVMRCTLPPKHKFARGKSIPA